MFGNNSTYEWVPLYQSTDPFTLPSWPSSSHTFQASNKDLTVVKTRHPLKAGDIKKVGFLTPELLIRWHGFLTKETIKGFEQPTIDVVGSNFMFCFVSYQIYTYHLVKRINWNCLETFESTRRAISAHFGQVMLHSYQTSWLDRQETVAGTGCSNSHLTSRRTRNISMSLSSFHHSHRPWVLNLSGEIARGPLSCSVAPQGDLDQTAREVAIWTSLHQELLSFPKRKGRNLLAFGVVGRCLYCMLKCWLYYVFEFVYMFTSSS